MLWINLFRLVSINLCIFQIVLWLLQFRNFFSIQSTCYVFFYILKSTQNTWPVLKKIFRSLLFLFFDQIFLDRYVYLGLAVSRNPGYLKLRKIRAAQSIARTVSDVFLYFDPNLAFQIAHKHLFISLSSLFVRTTDRQFAKQSVFVSQ